MMMTIIISNGNYVSNLKKTTMTFNSTHQKINVAIIQLDSAIEYFNAGKYIEAITLAGASEEILGAFCKRAHIATSVEKIADLSIMKKYPNAVTLLNSPRNCLKHANNPNEDTFEIAEEDHFLMIVRAIGNLRELQIQPSKLVQEFCTRFNSN